MAGLINTAEAQVLDQFFTIFGATLYVGLSSTTPTETGTNITEPSTGAYARVAITNASFAAAVGGAPSTRANSATITWPTATADWVSAANLTHFVIYTASTAGTVIAWGALGTAKPILNGDTASMAIGALILQLGDPSDTY